MYPILCWIHTLKTRISAALLPHYVNFEILFLLIAVCHYYRNIRLLSESVRSFSEIVRYKFKPQIQNYYYISGTEEMFSTPSLSGNSHNFQIFILLNICTPFM